METEQLERQFQMWNRFMYMILGSSITFVLTSFGNIVYGTDWPGFGNYVGGIWTSIQLLATLLGFYLLWGRRWKSIPLSSRINTIFGYFVASWINLLSLWLIASMTPPTEYYLLLVGSAIVMVLGYVWAWKTAFTPRGEMFP